MKFAFKEWAVVVDALHQGEQILILRKGGIAEGRGGFQPEHPTFALFPTGYHQQRESVLPSAQLRFDQGISSWVHPDRVRFTCWAHVQEVQQIRSLETVAALQGQHVWKEEVLAQRFDWGREAKIFALLVRVYRWAQPIELPLDASYGGCKSWVELLADLDPTGSTPVLSEAEFAQHMERFHRALGV